MRKVKRHAFPSARDRRPPEAALLRKALLTSAGRRACNSASPTLLAPSRWVRASAAWRKQRAEVGRNRTRWRRACLDPPPSAAVFVVGCLLRNVVVHCVPASIFHLSPLLAALFSVRASNSAQRTRRAAYAS